MATSIQSFQSFFLMAILLQCWITQAIQDYKAHGLDAFKDRYNRRGNHSDNLMSMHDLYPSWSRINSTLFQNCFTVSQEEYQDDFLDDMFCRRFSTYVPESNDGHIFSRGADYYDHRTVDVDELDDLDIFGSFTELEGYMEDEKDDFIHG